jgi:aspartate/methionine/tyrosine aminotransferase
VGLINDDQRFIRVVRGPEERIKKNNNKIFYVGLPNNPSGAVAVRGLQNGIKA